MDATFLPSGNPVLTRELRVVLRNARTFALLAIYVSVLGAVVMSQFPGGQALSFDGGRATMGRQLFGTFFMAQLVLVLVLVPGLATGTLAQERERRTLEPLLLTPMTPLGIVWGKASGVLALTGLLLLATLPLTSLCFLLGGVSPGELVSAYAVLLGLALFTTALGLYCSSKWSSTTQATVLCYAYLPVLLALITIFVAPGMLVSGILILLWGFGRVAVWWRSKSEAALPKMLGPLWELLLWMVQGALAIMLLYLMVTNYEIGIIIVGVLFFSSYLFVAAYAILREAAREMAQKQVQMGPMRERVQDFKEEWQRAVAAPETAYLPAPTGPHSYSSIAPQTDPFAALARSENAPLPGMTLPQSVSQSASQNAPEVPIMQAALVPIAPVPATPKTVSRKDKITYGVEPFLSDTLNPIFAKDMRAGLFGKSQYFFRFAYGATILTEVLLLLFVGLDSSTSSLFNFTDGWARLHMILLLCAGAFFGARSLAPEREQQTLPQLLTVPLPSSAIIGGKIMAVMAYTSYVFLMALPLMLLLPMLGELPWSMTILFLGLELAFGAFAAAWGLFCSIQCLTVRRALGWSLGGILVLLLGGPLLDEVVRGLMASTSGDPFLDSLRYYMNVALPLPALESAMRTFAPAFNNYGATASQMDVAATSLATMFLYLALTAILLVTTARAFKHYAQDV